MTEATIHGFESLRVYNYIMTVTTIILSASIIIATIAIFTIILTLAPGRWALSKEPQAPAFSGELVVGGSGGT